MSFINADRVKETTTTTGTGTYSLAGAATGVRTFVAGVGNANRCIYCVEDGTNWEINEGIVTDAAPDTLTRARLLASSTGSAINWGAGTKNIFAVYSAADTNPRVKALTTDYTNNTTTGTEVAALSQTVEPGTYRFAYFVILRSAATTTGISLGVNFTGTQTALVIGLRYSGISITDASSSVDDVNVANTPTVQSGFASRTVSTTAPNLTGVRGVATANVDHLLVVEGVIVVTVAGDLELWAASEIGTSEIRLQTGSNLELLRVN
jgi:hypothetical protein